MCWWNHHCFPREYVSHICLHVSFLVFENILFQDYFYNWIILLCQVWNLSTFGSVNQPQNWCDNIAHCAFIFNFCHLLTLSNTSTSFCRPLIFCNQDYIVLHSTTMSVIWNTEEVMRSLAFADPESLPHHDGHPPASSQEPNSNQAFSAAPLTPSDPPTDGFPKAQSVSFKHCQAVCKHLKNGCKVRVE